MPSSPNQILASAERVIQSAEAGRLVFIYQGGDQISIRDNSGQEGLCDDRLMDAVERVLHLLFPDFPSPRPTVPPVDAPLKVEIVGGKLVISMGVVALAQTSTAEFGGPLRKYRVDGGHEEEWAKDVGDEMIREDHDGATPLSQFIDRMMKFAVREGSGAVVPK